MGRAQSAMTSLVRELVESAAAAGRIEVADAEAATYMILSLDAAFITTETLGNDAGVRRPDVEGITSFCLHGLRAKLDDGWFDAISSRLRLPGSRPEGQVPAMTGPGPRRRSAPSRKRAAKKP